MEVLGKLRRRVEEVRYGSDKPGRYPLSSGRSGVDPGVAAEAARNTNSHVESSGTCCVPGRMS